MRSTQLCGYVRARAQVYTWMYHALVNKPSAYAPASVCICISVCMFVTPHAGKNVRFLDLSKLPKKYRDKYAEQSRAKLEAYKRAKAQEALVADAAAAFDSDLTNSPNSQPTTSNTTQRGQHGAEDAESVDVSGVEAGTVSAGDVLNEGDALSEEGIVSDDLGVGVSDEVNLGEGESEDGLREVDVREWRRSLLERSAEATGDTTASTGRTQARLRRGQRGRLLGRAGLRRRHELRAAGADTVTAGNSDTDELAPSQSTGRSRDAREGNRAGPREGLNDSDGADESEGESEGYISVSQLQQLVDAAQESGLDTQQLLAEALAMGKFECTHRHTHTHMYRLLKD